MDQGIVAPPQRAVSRLNAALVSLDESGFLMAPLRRRLRPVLMASMATAYGMLPLAY